MFLHINTVSSPERALVVTPVEETYPRSLFIFLHILLLDPDRSWVINAQKTQIHQTYDQYKTFINTPFSITFTFVTVCTGLAVLLVLFKEY